MLAIPCMSYSFRTGRKSRVSTSNRMLKQMLYRYQGNISAALVLGGVDINGPSLYSIYPHGSTDKLPYVTMGSGSLAAMGVFEDGWHPDMTVRLEWPQYQHTRTRTPHPAPAPPHPRTPLCEVPPARTMVHMAVMGWAGHLIQGLGPEDRPTPPLC